MYRPQKDVWLKTWNPTSPEYGLIDLMVSESFEAVSPEILWWCMDEQSTKKSMDSLDKVYGEKSSAGKTKFTGPYNVCAKIDFNPIIKEITRLGTETKEEIEIFVNIASIYDQLEHKIPKSGDILRISYIGRDPSMPNSKSTTFYNVSVVTPTDLYNHRYINFQISAEQTSMADVPDDIKKLTY